MDIAVDQLASHVAVSRAAAASRSGDLAGGLAMLEGHESPEAVDLRARILAQLGRWEEADEVWAVLETPGIPAELVASAGAGRALARKVIDGRARKRPVLRPAGATVAGIVVLTAVVGGIAVLTTDNEVAAEPAAPVVSPSTVTITPTAQIEELNRRLKAQEAAAAARAAKLDALASAVAMPGVTVRREAGAVRVVFDRGLFASGTTFSDGSTQLLDRLAPRLKSVPGINVVGQSVVVPGSEPSGGSAMALARARVVAQRLSQAGELPLTKLALSSGDQAQPLFPGAARNRTVSLLLTG